MTPEETILRYLKVRALAEQGSPGEKQNAQGIVARMERDHPTLRVEAEEYLRRKEREMHAAHGAPPPPRASNPFTSGNWENIFQFAHKAFTHASGFVDVFTQTARAKALAERVEAGTRWSKTGRHLLISLKLEPGVVERLGGLSDVQVAIFRTAMHQLLDRELDALLGR